MTKTLFVPDEFNEIVSVGFVLVLDQIRICLVLRLGI